MLEKAAPWVTGVLRCSELRSSMANAPMYRDRAIVAIVRFPLDPPLPADDVRAMFEASAPSYQDVPGLLRKHYLRAEDGANAGGVHPWKSRAAAEAVYDDAWHEALHRQVRRATDDRVLRTAR